MATTFSNLWLGYSEVTFANVAEKGQVDIVTPSDYLNAVDYVVDIHMAKASLGSALENVAIAYTTSGVDFSENGEEVSDRGNVWVYHTASSGKTFLLSNTLGANKADLKKLYVEHVNAGADKITLTSTSKYLGINPITSLDQSAGQIMSVDVAFSNVSGSGVACAAIPKALSAQLEGFGDDENLLRLVASANTYNNLMGFPLGGSEDIGGGIKSLAGELEGKAINAVGTVDTVKNILTRDQADMEIGAVFPGDLIIAALFNTHPPRVNDNMADLTVETESEAGTNLWYRSNVYSDPAIEFNSGVPSVGDVLRINQTGADMLAGTDDIIQLQYVLKTQMTLKSRDGADLNTTRQSPAAGLGFSAAKEVHILYNLIFDDKH